MNADGSDRSALSGPATDDAVIELLTSRASSTTAACNAPSGFSRAAASTCTRYWSSSASFPRERRGSSCQVLALPLVTPQDFPDQPLLDGVLSSKFLKDSRILPIADGEDAIVLAMADPLDDFAVRAVAIATGKRWSDGSLRRPKSRRRRSGSMAAAVVPQRHRGHSWPGRRLRRR